MYEETKDFVCGSERTHWVPVEWRCEKCDKVCARTVRAPSRVESLGDMSDETTVPDMKQFQNVFLLLLP